MKLRYIWSVSLLILPSNIWLLHLYFLWMSKIVRCIAPYIWDFYKTKFSTWNTPMVCNNEDKWEEESTRSKKNSHKYCSLA